MRSPKSSGKPNKRRILILRRVIGTSMLPVLRPEQLVLATGLFRNIVSEQVVIVRHNGLDKIKRIEKIRDGRVYVIGDNPRASTDSRSFGWLPIEAVVAHVIWPRC